ncbi:uncharacterized protein LOC112568120 isoform X2 [Pomacea canaliculata]|nr:uncharacterized protein LOC112568120 isoform X2 [Pomacea canaliculata]
MGQKWLLWFLALSPISLSVVVHTQSSDSSLLSMFTTEISTSNPKVSMTQTEPTATSHHRRTTQGDCDGPPQPQWRTNVTFSGWKHGDVAIYTCKLTTDVYVKGTTTVVCKDGEWETPTILCAPTTCWYHHWRWGPVYKGSHNKTQKGLDCSAWSSDSPHNKEDKYKDDNVYTVDGSKMAAGSYCRVFADDHPSAWCYTTSNQTQRDDCDVPRCDVAHDCDGPPRPLWRTHVTYSGWKHGDVANYTCNVSSDVYVKGTTTVVCKDGEWETPTILCAPTTCWYHHWRWGPVYKGSHNKTQRGLNCSAWSSDSPHNKEDKYKDDNVYTVDGSKMAAGSYCRVFADDHPSAWCYTTSNQTQRDDCDVPRCDAVHDCKGPPRQQLRTRMTYSGWKHGDVAIYTCNVTSDVYVKGSTTVFCKDGVWEKPTILCAPTTCWYTHWRWGPVYKGSLNRTKMGFDCNAWTSDIPHIKGAMYKDDNIYTVDGSKSAAGSYCRTFADEEPSAWCYTTNTYTKWDECDVPRCDDVLDCEGPPLPYPRTNVTYSGWKHGDVATYTCKYKSDVFILGKTAMKCEYGTWEEPTIVCAPTTCWYTHWKWGPVYKGSLNKTKMGFDCNAWTRDSPHTKDEIYKQDYFYFVDGSKAAAGSYCRIFRDDYPSTWCYTTNTYTKWDDCDVPRCDDVRDCDGPPPSLLRTNVTYSGWSHGDVAVYTCQFKSDKYVKGISKISCRNGSWETPTILCALAAQRQTTEVAAQRQTTEVAADTQTTEDNVIQLTQVTPDFPNPTHSLITCQVTGNETVRSISFMEIFWRERQIVYANTSENGGLATKGLNSFGNMTKVSGKVSQTHPEESQLVVDIAAESCEDAAAGDFACVLTYSHFNSSDSQLARAELVASSPCDNTKLEVTFSSYPNRPLGFVVGCHQQSYDTLLTVELSLLPDKPLLSSGRRQIAYFDRFSSNLKPVLNPDLAEKGVASYSSPLTVYFSVKTCEDTGVYRCKAVYLPPGENIVKTVVSEARLPACFPGAVATVERNTGDFQRYETFVCRVDPTLVLQLVSLEVTVVRNGSRQVLAYINSFLNDKVSFSSDRLRVEGEIYPLAPAASSLNVTSLVSFDEGEPSFITSCKAVYTDRNTTSKLYESFADEILRYFR